MPPETPNLQPAGDLPAPEQAEIAALIAETRRVLALPAFERNLAAAGAEFGMIAQSPFGKRLPAATVAAIIQGRDGRYAFYPTAVSWGNEAAVSTAHPGVIALSRRARDNWRAATPQERALAINSLAHEITHTITSCSPGLCLVFADRGFSFGWLRGNPPLVSYTVGSVAQCTWREEQGIMPEGLIACVRRFGVRSFTP